MKDGKKCKNEEEKKELKDLIFESVQTNSTKPLPSNRSLPSAW